MLRVKTNPIQGKPFYIHLYDREQRDGKEVAVLAATARELVNRTDGRAARAAEIWSIFVWPKQRKKGYATALIRFLQGKETERFMPTSETMAAKPFEFVLTQWSATTPVMRKTLLKCGFIKEQDSLIWRK